MFQGNLLNRRPHFHFFLGRSLLFQRAVEARSTHAGFMTYTADGRVSVVIASSQREPFSTFPAPAEELREALSNFIAYAGSYTLDGAKVTNHVEVCSALAFVNTDLVRSVKFEGDRLAMRWGPHGAGSVRIAYTDYVWERLKPETAEK